MRPAAVPVSLHQIFCLRSGPRPLDLGFIFLGLPFPFAFRAGLGVLAVAAGFRGDALPADSRVVRSPHSHPSPAFIFLLSAVKSRQCIPPSGWTLCALFCYNCGRVKLSIVSCRGPPRSAVRRFAVWQSGSRQYLWTVHGAFFRFSENFHTGAFFEVLSCASACCSLRGGARLTRRFATSLPSLFSKPTFFRTRLCFFLFFLFATRV